MKRYGSENEIHAVVRPNDPGSLADGIRTNDAPRAMQVHKRPALGLLDVIDAIVHLVGVFNEVDILRDVLAPARQRPDYRRVV